MPSHRSRHRRRSRERSYSAERARGKSRSRSPELHVQLPNSAPEISEADYFKKFEELSLWLREEKRKYINELSGDKARSYFRKFVKAWNRGKLPGKYYEGIDSVSLQASDQTGYKWSFASKQSRAEDVALRAARQEINAATNVLRKESYDTPSSSNGPPGRLHGPTLPSASDLTLAREYTMEHAEKERAYQRKRDKAEARERIEDMVGPKAVGKEAMLEKKHLRRENDRAFRERGDDGFEVDESTLMGGDSFQDRIARRDAAKRRYEQKAEEKSMALRERANAMRDKEKATMDMLQQLAKQRFG